MFRDYGFRGLGFYLGIGGVYWDNGKENGNYRDYRDYIGSIRDYGFEGVRV